MIPADYITLTTDQQWRALEGHLRPFVNRRIPSEDVDDVMQDIFLRIQRGLPELRDERRFGPWVYRVARSTVLDHLRRQARAPTPTPEVPQMPDVDDSSDEVQQEVAGYAALFVAMMPSPYREALTLIELEGLTHKEAAQTLGVSVSAVKSRVRRGRQKVRTALDACCRIALDSRKRVIACEPRPDGRLPSTCCV